MVRLSKLADYGLVLMASMAQSQQSGSLRTARDLAEESKLPLPTVSRLLKLLLHQNLLISHRGNHGGYALARDPGDISIIDIVAAIEGPMALTECSTGVPGVCEIETCCSIRKNQILISQVVLGALRNIRLSDLIQPLEIASITDVRGNLLPSIRIAPGRNLIHEL